MPITATQRETRKTGIGGSDMPTILNLDTPYNKPDAYTLYLIKRGEIEQPERFGEYTSWGNLLEEPIAKAFAERNGVKLQMDNETHRSKTRPYLIGHADRRIIGAPRSRLEIKQTAHRTGWGATGSAEVPLYVYAQCQHYIEVMELDEMRVAVLIAGNDYRDYVLPRNEQWLSVALDKAEEFWDRVEAGAPPEPEWSSRSISDLMAMLYPGTDGRIVELPAEIAHWQAVLDEAKEQEALYKSVVEGARNRIRQAMGEASVGIMPDGMVWTRKRVERKGYTVEPTSYIDMRHGKPAKGIADAIEAGQYDKCLSPVQKQPSGEQE